MAIQWLINDPLARVPGESLLANQALRDYADQTPGQRAQRELWNGYRQRSASGELAKKPPTTSYTTIEGWSIKHEWVARVARYDELERERIARLRAEAEAAEIAKWVQRRQEAREKEYNLGQGLLDRAVSMLRTPLFRTETEDGRNVIMPARWTLGDVPRIADTGSKLTRLAAEMPTAREHVDFEGMTDADLIGALAARIGGIIPIDAGGPEAEPEPGWDQGSSTGDSEGEGSLPEVA
jgi:hypothetical protein